MGETSELIAVRHGQSLANLRVPAAEQAGEDVTGLPARDADVPLTALGVGQARAVGSWLCAEGNSPDTVLCSPYARTRETYQHALMSAAHRGRMLPMARTDERLRDRSQGVLQLLTETTMRRRFPEEYARRAGLGPFRYRPPGGENFADVTARVRALLDGIRAAGPLGTRTLLVTHDAVVLALRAAAEHLDEDALAAVPLVPNGSVSRWPLDAGGRLQPGTYGETGHLAAA